MRRLQLAVTALLFLAGCTGAPAGAAAAKATVNITPTLVAVAAPSPTAPPPSVTPRSDASPTPQPQAPATPTTGITVPLASEGTPAVNDVIRIESIRSAYNILMDKYYKSLKSNDLLKAAWIGVVDRATSAKPAGALATPAFTGDRIADFKLFQDRYAALVGSNTSYDPVQLSFGAIEGMTSSLGDDHTAFLSPEINARFQQESSGGSQTVGLGVSLGGRNPPFVIQDVVPGGPADKAGVKPGDTIVAIDGQDVSKQDLQHIAGLLRGTAGTNVKLGLQRPGAANVEITVTRGPFVTPVLSSKILPNGVGYIRLRQFPQTYAKFPDGNTFEQELDAELAAFENAGVTVWWSISATIRGALSRRSRKLPVASFPMAWSWSASTARASTKRTWWTATSSRHSVRLRCSSMATPPRRLSCFRRRSKRTSAASSLGNKRRAP